MAALMLGTVFEQTKLKYQLKLLAGEEGLHRSIRWMNVSEDIGNADFLQGGELVIFTGYSFESITEFEEYIKMLQSKQCCGAIVNVGKYIFEEDITQELLYLCNERQFPLIAMPWKYYLTDILQEYSKHIFYHKQEQDQLIFLFQSLLQNTRPYSTEDETRLLAYHFSPQGAYCVCVMSEEQKGKAAPTESLLRALDIQAENHLNRSKKKACVFLFQNAVVLVFHHVTQSEILAQMESIEAQSKRALPGHRLVWGAGSVVSGAEYVKTSYDQACTAMLYGIDQNRHHMSFQDMDEFQLFYACRDQKALEQFTDIIWPLESYEEKQGSQLLETLRLYLKYSGSVNQVANALNCHRNTINYRIKKIRELLQMNLDSNQVRFQLQMALSIRDYQRLDHLK